MHNAESHACGYPRVYCVATCLQDVKACLGREEVTCRHHVSRAVDGRLQGHYAASHINFNKSLRLPMIHPAVIMQAVV